MKFNQTQISSMLNSILLDTDSYKMSHFLQYPDGTEYVWDYVSSRGGQYEKIMFFGLQMFIKAYLQGPVVTKEAIDLAELFAKAHGEPFNREGWEYILKKHNGYLPLKIRAVREGTLVPAKQIVCSVVNTDPKCGWLTSYVEPSLLRGIWYPSTVATRSRYIKDIIKKYLENTADNASADFKLHDFGARGVSSKESSGIGDAGHMVNFLGSDTMIGILYAMKYYPEANGTSEVLGFSIPAAEHSTTTILGPGDGETAQFRRMIQQFGKPGAIFACVSDGFDIYKACEKWGTELIDELKASGATLVVRPDSGDPVECTIKCLRILEKHFGAERNSKGFKVLNNVRVIYGDGINELTVNSILLAMEWERFSADNVAFGMGGELLQTPNRDTNKWAMKCSAACINGEWVDVYKDPITDKGKASFKGQMSLFRNKETGEYASLRIDQGEVDPVWEDQFVDVFENGELLVEYSFTDVRKLANSQ